MATTNLFRTQLGWGSPSNKRSVPMPCKRQAIDLGVKTMSLGAKALRQILARTQ
jgi:hypothetical protein